MGPIDGFGKGEESFLVISSVGADYLEIKD